MNTASLNSPASTPATPATPPTSATPAPTATGAAAAPGAATPTAPATNHTPDDPRVGWTAAPDNTTPPLHERRDGILPAVAAALSVRGRTLTSTGNKGDQPPAPHPLVQDFLDTLTTEHRARHTGRCPETVLLSRYLTTTENARAAKRGNRRTGNAKPRALTHSEAKRALKHAKLTARHIREDGDPLHGRYAPPCRACSALLTHFGVRPVDPGTTGEKAPR
ncbi:YwqJ-related putative deaminase [Streptomyces sp. WMMB 322]|uniref:YwqJ-related putative deaminase n=1 Tax=Streptomyces sp. WMMB 322 TaxID=1286821 RepID=UPI000823C117|nr:YwqJ-related putative deaminase [Streptomyces sp. WMMB 322]SCK10511.1 YwqJ-like deaminase [Streptomyces sp. WMMB 322]